MISQWQQKNNIRGINESGECLSLDLQLLMGSIITARGGNKDSAQSSIPLSGTDVLYSLVSGLAFHIPGQPVQFPGKS